MKKTIGLAAAIALALSATPALAAKFYKWTDADGVTHYSADPPPATAKASEVKVRTRRAAEDAEPAADATEASAGQPAGAAAPAAAGSAPAKAKEPAKPEDAAGKDKKPETGKERYAEKCKQLRSNLQAMEEHGRVKESDDKGNVRVLTDDEKNERLDATQRQIKAFCE